MATTKTIVLPITYVSKDGAASEPIEYDGNYAVVKGRTVYLEHAAGTPLKLPADVADDLLAKWGDRGAREVDSEGVDIVARAAPKSDPPTNKATPRQLPPAPAPAK